MPVSYTHLDVYKIQAVAWLKLGVLGIQGGFEAPLEQNIHPLACSCSLTVGLGIAVQCVEQINQLCGVCACIEEMDELLTQVFMIFLGRAAISILKLAQVLPLDERYGLPDGDRAVMVSPSRKAARKP